MSCDRCSLQWLPIKISSAASLSAAITKVTTAIESGALVYRGAGKMGDPFFTRVKKGLWGDFVSNYFACSACGQLLHLHAETYHGAGGALEMVTVIKEELLDEDGQAKA